MKVICPLLARCEPVSDSYLCTVLLCRYVTRSLSQVSASANSQAFFTRDPLPPWGSNQSESSSVQTGRIDYASASRN